LILANTAAQADVSGTGSASVEHGGGARPIDLNLDLDWGSVPVGSSLVDIKIGGGQNSKAGTTGAFEANLALPKMFASQSEAYYTGKPDGKILYFVITPQVSVKTNVVAPKSEDGSSRHPELTKLDIDMPLIKPMIMASFDQTKVEEQKGAAVEFTPLFLVPNAGFVYTNNKLSQTKGYGAELTILDPSLKVAFTVHGKQVEMCMGLRPGIVLGKNQIGETSDSSVIAFRVDAKGCANLKLGDLGKLGYEIDYRLNSDFAGNYSQEITQSVTLRDIAKTPFYIQYAHVLDQNYLDDGSRKGAVSNMGFVGVSGF
jgi:hypothetical protein